MLHLHHYRMTYSVLFLFHWIRNLKSFWHTTYVNIFLTPKILKKNDIDFEQLTAGEHKRTLTLFGENTDKARKKFIEDLELTHQLFKDFVQQQRTKVDINKVATGEIWLGVKAKENNLVDELTTSDDYLTELAKDYELFEVTYVIKKSLTDKLGVSIQKGVEQCVIRLLEQLQLSRYLH